MVDIVNIALLHFIAIDEKFMLRKGVPFEA